MDKVNEPYVQLEEVTVILRPENGATLDQALADAAVEGWETMEIDREKNCATICFFKRKRA